jgi:signal transduction histidine kinase
MVTPSVDNPVRRGLTAMANTPSRIEAREAALIDPNSAHGLVLAIVQWLRLSTTFDGCEGSAERPVFSVTPTLTPASSPAGNPDEAAVEPLFAHNARFWVRVWIAIQSIAILITTGVLLEKAGGLRRFFESPGSLTACVMLAVLVTYYVIGLLLYDWILHRRWGSILFVPLGWALVLLAVRVSGAFGLLLLGSALQGFLFLPFSWAAATLAVLTIGFAGVVARHAPTAGPGVVLVQVSAIVAIGVMIGTVMLYIHRANREALMRARLVRQLHGAQRDLADRARDAGVQEERQRFARDIHDTLAQGFTSVITHLEAVELSLQAAGPEGDPATQRLARRVMGHVAHAQAASRANLADIRRLVWALRPVELGEAPLAAALTRVVAQWGEANAITTTCVIEPIPPLHADADVALLRATQESLSNVARHAGATRVMVSVSVIDELVLLTVEDDGRGFVHVETMSSEKVGLSGMRERVRRFGGHLLIESTVGVGTSLTVAIPLSSVIATPTPAVGAG